MECLWEGWKNRARHRFLFLKNVFLATGFRSFHISADNFRPYLTTFQSNDNTDYINAVFVDVSGSLVYAENRMRVLSEIIRC